MDALVARLSAMQHGLFLRTQVLDTGMSDAMIEYRVRVGRWIRVCPGLYRLAGVPVTWKQRALGACLVAGEGAVVSHRSAAVLWGVSGFRPGSIEITVPDRRSVRNRLAQVHRSKEVTGVRREGIPVTRPARMLVDLASVVGAGVLEEAVDDVLCRRLCRLDEVVEPAGRRGSRELRAVLDAWNGDALPDGVAEMRVVRRLLAVGLPQPARQHEIYDRGRFVARVDLAYPDHRLAIELDGFRWHAGRGPFRSDRLRRNRIEAAGWRLLETAPDDVDELCREAAGILRWAA